MARNIIIGCMMLGLLVSAQSAVGAQYDYELAYSHSGQDAGFREAVDMDDWLERGRAAVTESPVFPDGIRLAAWGGENAFEPGLASAIYYFHVPRWAQYLKITIQYHDAALDDSIAGRLWIKSADRDRYETLGVGEEAPLYGDTFVLRSERTSETIIVPRSRHVEDNTVEMHIVAEGLDSLDVRDVRLVFLETRPDNITIVRRTDIDYWHRWPRHRYAYHYFYWGPLFWPRTYVVYECWDVPSPFYWITWRPWFFINIILVHHHHPWWGPRRYTVVYHMDVKHPPIKRRHLIHKRLKERHVHITRTIRPKSVIRKPHRHPVLTQPGQKQEVRLKQKRKTPRTFKTRVNPNPNQRHLKEQSIRRDTGQAKQQSRTRPLKREKTVQVPVQKQLKKSRRDIATTNRETKPTPMRRGSQEQPAQETKRPKRLAVNKKAKTVKRPQVINKPDSRPARPPRAKPQPRTAKQQSRSRPVAREIVREPTKGYATQNHRIKQRQTVQKDAKIRQGKQIPIHQEIRQERPYAEQQRPR